MRDRPKTQRPDRLGDPMRLTQAEGTVIFPRRPGLRPSPCVRVPAVSSENLGGNGPGVWAAILFRSSRLTWSGAAPACWRVGTSSGDAARAWIGEASGAAVGKESMKDVTRIRSAVEQGEAGGSEQLLPLVCDELRKLAARKLAQEKPGQTLQATALVHEAYLRWSMPIRPRAGTAGAISLPRRRRLCAASSSSGPP